MPDPVYLEMFFLCAALGTVSGTLAGLLGIGGGAILVPGLFYGFTLLGFDPAGMMHLAVGTSLAIIIPTAISSARAHYKRGAVMLNTALKIGVGIVVGTVIGSLIADKLGTDAMQLVFGTILLALAFVMIRPKKYGTLRNTLPSSPFQALAGVVIGAISTLMGIGGGTMNVPYMTLHGVPVHRAVGTASLLGLFIAVPGVIGFMLIGINETIALPPFSIGYVNLLAFACIVPFSVLCAPFGAKLAHKLSVEKLRRIFAILMVLVAVKMLIDGYA